MRLSQIAVSVTDLRRTQRWYREVLGLEPSGGTNLFAGPLAAMVQGVPRAASTCWWLLDRQELFQLELFEFRSPLVRPLPHDWRPCDVGYTTVSFCVDDLDAALRRATAAGGAPLTAPLGSPGKRRACLRDPEGVLIELMEEDPRAAEPRRRPRPGLAAVARSVTLSVSDLEPSARFFGEILGLDAADSVALHAPEHEALWGLEGARRESLLMWADDFLVELVRYLEPAGRPWPPGYRISDQGIVNIAFGFRERTQFEAAHERCLEAGFRGNGPPLRLGAWSVVYVNDNQGFSVELLHIEPWYERQMGFRPRPTPRLAPLAGRTPARCRTERGFAKGLVTGAAGGLGTELCRLLAEDRTSLLLLDRDASGMARLAGELEDGVEVATQELDLADLEAVDAGMAELTAAHPDVDLLIAAAGLDRAQSLLAFDWRQARDDFAVNSLANLVLLSHLVPKMAARGGGHITAIASLAGVVGMPYEAPYSASKAALATITESARAELEPRGITFTAVFPGFVDTPMFRANAFKHPYAIAPRDAAERIYMATLRRRETLHFPALEHAKLRLARALPARVRDRITRQAMSPPADIESRGAGSDDRPPPVQRY
ncbi:MAG TPA: SDR family NAD(P)-dependent oxidoreductase [Solirubrobacterales bacterium]|nr:SDR family NAD(P)-dependent oxidoreductase [Solirubrobacterales bacterium]